MRIIKVELFKASLPLKRPFRIALGETHATQTMFVRLTTDTGLIGMGEADCFRPVVGENQAVAIAAGQDYGRLLLGKDPLAIDRRVTELRNFMPATPTTRSAFDIALHDIAAQAAGLPLYAYFGGEKRTLETDITVGIDTPEAMATHAREIADRGLKAIKIKLGTGAQEDIARMRAIRSAIGNDIALRIDANQGWDRADAMIVLDAIAPLGVQYCEQPVRAWDVEGMAAVAARSAIPVMADETLFDEHDALRLVSSGTCHYLNIKLAKAGGLHVALRINTIAEAGGFKCMVGCMTETRLALTAAAHLVSSRPNIAFADLDGADMLKDDPVTGGMVYGENGAIHLPDTPGLGASIDPDYLSSLECITLEEGAAA